MLKRGISQMFELKACVFWAPGSQELAMLGRQICRSVHWTYFDPTSSGCEHTAEVWCGTVTIVFHVAGALSPRSSSGCPVLKTSTCTTTQGSVVWWVHTGTLSDTTFLQALQTPSVTNYILSLRKNQMPPPGHQKKRSKPKPQQPDLFTTSSLKSMQQ